MLILEIFVGLLALIAALTTLYPFVFGILFGAQIMVFGTIILAVTILIVGTLGVMSVFSNENLSLAKKINIVTSVLTIAMSVTILYFQITSAGLSWLHILFGLGLLGYSVGQVAIGVLTREVNFGFRAYFSAMGIAIGALSSIVLLFALVQTSSTGGSTFYLSYGYFVRIALVLIGVNCLISAALATFLKRQKQSPVIEMANPLLLE